MDSNKVHLFTSNDESNVTNKDKNSPMHNILMELLQEGIQENTEENLANQRSIMEFLHRIELEPSSLPNDIKEELDKVSLVLKEEGLSHVNKTSLGIVKQRKNIQEMEKNIFEKEINMKLKLLVIKAKSLEKKIDCLQMSINNANDMVQDIKKDTEDSQNTFMTMKLKEYNQVLEKLETDLNNMRDIDSEPDILLKKYKQYINMTEQVVKLDQFLDQYNDLPPDLMQARILLENKQKEYEELGSISLF